MDGNPWVSALVLLITLMELVSGLNMKPQNVTVHIWDGNVTVTWDPPEESPPGCRYTVEVAEYPDAPRDWTQLTNCNLLTQTLCNIGTFNDFQIKLVRVVNHMNHDSFMSREHRFNIRHSRLLPPSFTLLSTPFSLQVKMQRKKLPIVFPFGLDYTAYLWPEGHENQTQSDDDADEDGEIRFSHLDPWRVYCVRVQVKSGSGPNNMSTVECTRLPLDMALIIYFVFLGLLGFVAVLMFFVCCFLRRPTKMPNSLKPVVNSWSPMVVRLDDVEVVTDKGWRLFSNSFEEKRRILEEGFKCPEEWRESLQCLDPSVGDTKTDGQTQEDTQEDSGCGSLKSTEGSGSAGRVVKEFGTLDAMSCDCGSDSGLGLGHREVSSSLESEDGGLLSKVLVGDGYRSQSPSSVDVKNETAESCDTETNMAAPSTGYRCGQVTCSCLEQEFCVWCKFRKPWTEDRQSLTQLQTDLVQTIFESEDGDSNYREKTLNLQTVNLLGLEDSISVTPSGLHQSDVGSETSPFLFSCPQLLRNVETQDCISDTRSFMLEDVKLAFL